MDKNEFENKKQELAEDLEKAKTDADEVIEIVTKIRSMTVDDLEQMTENRDTLSKISTIISSIPADLEIDKNPNIEDAFNSAYNLGEALSRHYNYLNVKSKQFIGEMTILNSGIGVAYAIGSSGLSSAYVLATEIEPVYPQMKRAIETLKIPSTFDHKREIEDWLLSINERLAKKYQEAYDNLNSSNFMSANHAMREALSDLLEVLASDDSVEACEWYNPVPDTDRPTQRQRIKFAIIGDGEDISVSDEDVETIDKTMNEGRDIYKKLSAEAHLRKGDWEHKRTLNYFDISNNVILTIKRLRKE